jgi:hypothetical protein
MDRNKERGLLSSDCVKHSLEMSPVDSFCHIYKEKD